jgi:hypothetical protein
MSNNNCMIDDNCMIIVVNPQWSWHKIIKSNCLLDSLLVCLFGWFGCLVLCACMAFKFKLSTCPQHKLGTAIVCYDTSFVRKCSTTSRTHSHHRRRRRIGTASLQLLLAVRFTCHWHTTFTGTSHWALRCLKCNDSTKQAHAEPTSSQWLRTVCSPCPPHA